MKQLTKTEKEQKLTDTPHQIWKEILEEVNPNVNIFFETANQQWFTTIKGASQYYQVNADTIKKLINRKLEGFVKDGSYVTERKNVEVSEGSIVTHLFSKTSHQLRLLTPRAVARIGFFLEVSSIADNFREYMLDNTEKQKINKTSKKENLRKDTTIAIRVNEKLKSKLQHYANKVNKTKKEIFEDFLDNLPLDDNENDIEINDKDLK